MDSILRAGRRGVHETGRTATGLALSALLALTLAAPVQTASAVGAAEQPGGAPGARPHDPAVRPTEDPLARPARGTAAVDRLGDRLPEVARLNGLSHRGLSELLEEDPSAWVATDGRVFFRDPKPSGAEIAAAPEPEAAASAPLSETFALHSRPGAARTIFLDVDGSEISGTDWNELDGVGTSHPAWDPSRNGAAFTDAELAEVQAVWEMVAADFAAFDVDVTTEDPGHAGLTRTDSDDTTYGAHVVITPSDDAWNGICGRLCGGVAYLNVFGEVDGGAPYYQPAWVFTEGVGDSAKGVAEAASHEVGHQLGLQHDGKDGKDYYRGHGSWGPIMGATYFRPVSQWSRGDYAGATNTENDVAVIAGEIPRVADEAGAGTGGSAPLPEGTAYVTSRTDVDTYGLGACSGAVVAGATTAGLGPDLDLQLTLLDADGAVVATADPASATVDSSRASGMDATLSTDVPAGTYHLSVDGVGNGTPDTGYDDYASIGGYDLSVTGCDGGSPAGAPSAPQDLTATPDAIELEVALTWSAPAVGGDSEITGYTVARSGSATPVVLAAGARSHTLTGLEAGTAYTIEVHAQNASGAGPSTTVTATTAAPPVRVPGAPRSFVAAWDADDRAVRLSWLPPDDDGGGAITGYAFRVDGSSAGNLPGDARSATGSGWGPGTHSVQIRAVNSAGEGTAVTRDATVPALVTRTWTGRSVSDRTVRLRAIVRLPDGEVDEGGPPTGTVRFSEEGAPRGQGTLEPLDAERAVARLVLRDVLPGEHAYRAAYTPDDMVRLAPSADRSSPVTVGKLASTTWMRAPRRTRAGNRPVVRVRVDGGAEQARGRVRMVVRAVDGRTSPRSATAWLRDGAVSFRLPVLRPGRVRVVARYRGSAVHLRSTRVRTIRVVRR